MNLFDRDRLIIAILVSLVVHGGVFAGISFVNFDSSVPEFSGPIYVEIPQLLDTRVPEEPEVEPPAEEPDPEPPEPETPPETPPAQVEPQTESETATSPAQEQSPPPAQEQRETVDPLGERRDAPVDVSDAEIFGRSGSSRSRRAPEEPGPGGFLPSEDGQTEQELPDWARETMERANISTEEMSTEDATRLADKIRTDPALQRRLESVISAVESARTRDRRADDADAAADRDAASSNNAERAPGDATAAADSELQFLGGGSGTIRPQEEFPSKLLTAEDFPGVVPAEVDFVIVFEIDPSGIVVPGSVILQRKSPYTVVNEKIRRAVLSWTFTPHDASEPVTAIFTPTVRREQVRR
jgi:hypothetical protein